jgi:hypothetical protein
MNSPRQQWGIVPFALGAILIDICMLPMVESLMAEHNKQGKVGVTQA